MEYIDEMKGFTKEDGDFLASRFILVECSLICNRKLVLIERLYENRVRMSVGEQDAGGFYQEVWEYPSLMLAILSMLLWDQEKQSEPSGWDRHPDSGRYRIGGHRHLEFVRCGGDDVIFHIIHAVAVTMRSHAFMIGINEVSTHIDSSLPQGTRCFHAIAKLPCGKEQEWFVYHHWDRSVVIKKEDRECVMLSNVIQRLTGD